MIAGDGHHPCACQRRQPTHEAPELPGQPRIAVEQVTGQHDQIRLGLAQQLFGDPQLGVTDERANVHVRELRDAEAVERARQPRQLEHDLFDRVVVTALERAVQ